MLDGRTSEICRDMNGRIIPVTHLASQRDRLLGATTKEGLKSAAAWPRRFRGRTGDLPANVGLPPYHYKCRTEVFGIVDDVPSVDARYGDSLTDEDRERLEAFTPEEHGLRVRDIQARAERGDLAMSRESLQYHFNKGRAALLKHGRAGFGDPNTAAYAKRVHATVAAPDLVYAKVYRNERAGDRAAPRIQYEFLSAKNRSRAVIDADGGFMTCYPVHAPHARRIKEDRAAYAGRDGKEKVWLRAPKKS